MLATDRKKKTHQVTKTPDSPTSDDKSYNLFTIEGATNRAEPIMVTMNVSGADLSMEVDTGAHFSLISESTYRTLWPGAEPCLQPSNIPLQTYAGERLSNNSIRRTINVNVKYRIRSN